MHIPRVSTCQGKLIHLHEQLLIMGDLQKLKDKGKPVVNVMEQQFANTDSLRKNDYNHHVWLGCWPVNSIQLYFTKLSE